MLCKITDQGRQENPHCIDFVCPILLTYSDKMLHSSIKMTPYEATKRSNAIDATSTIYLQASFTRKYPELELGSSVMIYKQKH